MKKRKANNKYYVGKYSDYEDRRGWFIGDFFEEGHPCKTGLVEVQYNKVKKAGAVCGNHYHNTKVEILLFLQGKAIFTINEKKMTVKKGEFIFIDGSNSITIDFVEDCEFFSVHSPSLPKDKVKL